MKHALYALLLTAMPTLAENSLFELSLEELLAVRISSSTLQDESLLNVPSAVTIIKKEEIQALGISTIKELVNLVPGYQSYRGDTGNDSYLVSSRGLRRGQSTKGVLLLINGARFNINQTGGAFDGLNLPLDNVERVEVIRGPGSAIYGSNAFLGVINVITQAENSVELSAGSGGEKRLFIQGNHAVENHQLEASLWFRHRDGTTISVFGSEADNLMSAKDEFESQGIQLKYQYNNFENQTYFTREIDKQGHISGLPAKDEDDRFAYDNFFTEFKYLAKLNEALQVNSSASYHKSIFNPRITYTLSPLVTREFETVSDELLISSVLQYSTNQTQTWLAGAEYRHSTTEKSEITQFVDGDIAGTFPLQRERSQDILGAFIQNQQHFTDDLRGTLGIRYDHYQDFGGHLSARLGLTYLLDSNNSVKLLYGEAFRAPVRTETDINRTNFFVSNPNLEPETSKTTELIWASIINNGYFQASIFHTELIDNIVRTDSIPQSFENSGHEKSSGFEAEMLSHWGNSWQVRSALTYFVDRPNEDRSSESEFLFTTAATYDIQHYQISLILNHQSEKIDENSSESGFKKHDAFTQFDANFRYFLAEHYELFIRVNNLFDTKYTLPGSINSNEYGVEGYSRQFEAGIKVSF